MQTPKNLSTTLHRARMVSSLGALLLTGIGFGQPTQNWSSRHDQGGPLNEAPKKSTTDASGNFYVVGESNGNLVTGKFDSAGALLWTSRYSMTGDSTQTAAGIAVDGGGNVYVAGTGYNGLDDDMFVVKYSSAGLIQWHFIYDGPGNGNDVAKGFALDGSGNALVTGRSANVANDDMTTVKVNASGSLVWARHYNGSSNTIDQGNAVVGDAAGNVAVGGYSTEAGKQVFTVVLYNAAGTQQWAQALTPNTGAAQAVAINGSGVAATGYEFIAGAGERIRTAHVTLAGVLSSSPSYDGPSVGNDRGRAVRFDALGLIYVAGYVYNTGDRDMATLRYDTGGTLQFAQTFDAFGGDDEAAEIGLDGTDAIVSGFGTSGGLRAIVTVRYFTGGGLNWSRAYTTAGGAGDTANMVSVDAVGDVLVSGQVYNGSLQANDFSISKYAGATGSVVYEIEQDLGGGTEDYVQAAVVNRNTGDTYITGSYATAQGQDILTVKFNSVGIFQWARTYNGPVGGNDEGRAIALDGSGNILVAGVARTATGDDYVVIKYNQAGTAQWTSLYNGPAGGDDTPNGIASDGSNNVAVTGRSAASGGDNYATVYFNSAGVQQWAQAYNGVGNGYDEATAIRIDGSLNVIVTGYAWGGSNENVATIKYTSAGAVSWTQVFNGIANGVDAGWAVKTTSVGDVIVAGQSWTGASDDILTIKYTAAGALSWSRLFNGPGSDFDSATGLVIDASNNAYVTGYAWGGATDFDIATLKYDISGTLAWSRTYDGPGGGADFGEAINIDSVGDPYVTGDVESAFGDLHYATIRYDRTTGNTVWPASGGVFSNGAAIFDTGVGGSDAPVQVGLDTADNVYVAGTSRGFGTGADFHAVKYLVDPKLVSVSASPGYVVATDPATGTVTLTHAAPTGGALVTLSSSLSANATVPANVTVPAGSSSATFPITTANTGYSTLTATISATYAGVTKTGLLRVWPNNRAAFISQTVPSSMLSGQTYKVTYVYQNTGATTWTAARNYMIRTQLPTDNTVFGINRILVDTAASVLPGQSYSFVGYAVAPATPGAYSLRWRPLHGYVADFGPTTPAGTINVTASPNNAAFVSQIIPTSVFAGNDFTASVTMQNTGSSTWTQAAGYSLQTQNPVDNVRFGWNRIYPSSAVSILPGANHTFTRVMTAPWATTGTFNMQWRMSSSGGSGFGAFSTNVPIVVTTGPNNALFQSQSGIPTTIAAGATFSATVTMRNAGTATWTGASGHTLQTATPTNWGVTSIVPAGSVPQNTNHSFTATFTAPATPGTYQFQWRMKAGATAFGQRSTLVTITVT